jgi:AraC family transcriptional regulator of adaptative response / DNA-3-methyladenine glycosylase II
VAMGEIKDAAGRAKLYAALLARDFRFDGKFYVAVATTGVYCRPICPARPLERNCRFFKDSLSAERAGFRPCLRCRPETAPLSPAWYGTGAIVGRAIRYIRDCGLAGLSSEAFAAKFGVGARHLRRLFVKEIGKTPRELYEDLRLDLARSMLVETSLPATEIALSSGYGSVRRFNAAFKARFSRAPTELRSSSRGRAPSVPSPRRGEGFVLRLRYRPPYDWEAVLAFLARHAAPGIEEVGSGSYTRYYPTAGGIGSVRVEPDASRSALVASFDSFDRSALYAAVRRLRRLFDLDADPLLVSEALGRCPALRRLDERRPGIRVPGSWDPFETAVAIVLGQLVSTARARELLGILIRAYGRSLDASDVAATGVARGVSGAGASGARFAFPEPAVLAASDLSALPTTGARKNAIRALAAAVAGGRVSLHPHQEVAAAKRELVALPGIGRWTAEWIGMRCLSDPDSFPSRDLALHRAAPSLGLDLRAGVDEVRPWRAYAAFLLLRGAAGRGNPEDARAPTGTTRPARKERP